MRVCACMSQSACVHVYAIKQLAFFKPPGNGQAQKPLQGFHGLVTPQAKRACHLGEGQAGLTSGTYSHLGHSQVFFHLGTRQLASLIQKRIGEFLGLDQADCFC